MRSLQIIAFLALVFLLTVTSAPVEKLGSTSKLQQGDLKPHIHQAGSYLDYHLQKRSDPDPQDWYIFNRAISGPDHTLQRESDRNILRQRYEHLIHHNGMPVFAAETARSRAQAQLMKQAWADFGAVQLYGSPRYGSHDTFQVQSLLPSGNTYTYRRVANQDDLLHKLNYYHQLEAEFGPNLKQIFMGLPLNRHGNGRFGGHSTNRVWNAPKEVLSNYDLLSLRSKLETDRLGLFLSRTGEHLMAITIGNNGIAEMQRKVNEAAPIFVQDSRRF